MAKRIFEFVFFGNIFISLCAVGLCIETNLLLNIPLNHILFYVFIFGAALLQYNLHYFLIHSFVNSSDRLVWLQKNRNSHLLLIVTGVIAMSIGLFSFKLYQIAFLAAACIVTLLYSFSLLPFKNKKRIKDFGILKIITLALTWTWVTVWLPAEQKAYFSSSFLLIFAGRFVFIFIICLMFDMRDMEIDCKENRRTIPIIAGKQMTYRLINLLLVLFVFISLIQSYKSNNFRQFNAMLISSAATFFVVKISHRQPSPVFYLTCIDGMMLLQAMLIIIGSI